MDKKIVVVKCKGAETVSVELLKDFQGNLKTLSKTNYEKLKKELLRHGFCEPITIWRKDGKHLILNGHQRVRTLLMMQQDGYHIPDLPVNIVTPRDEKEAKEIVLALTSQFGEITDEGLYEFAQEAGIEFDFLEDLRFPEIDLERFKETFQDLNLVETGAEDNVPEAPVEPVSKLGDLYELGNHRLLCGDSTSIEAVERLMNGEKADMVFTDPPYGIGFKYNSHQDTTGDEYKDFCRDWFNILKVKSEFIIISTGWAYNRFWYEQDPKDCFYWICKNKRTGGSISHFRKVEPIFIWGKPENRYDFDFFEQTTQIEIEEELKGKHTCPKPVSLIQSIIAGCKNGGMILDVFGGSGTTLIACEKTKRKCFMMELDPQYVDVIVTRWCNYTGQTKIKKNGEEIEWAIESLSV